MADSFEVAQSSSEDELTDEQRHEVVAAQLRGEAKAAGQGPEALVAAVASELEKIGLEPDASELHRRYEEIDPEIPELTDAAADGADAADVDGDAAAVADAEVPPADRGTGAATASSASSASTADGPVAAGVDASREHAPVDDQTPR